MFIKILISGIILSLSFLLIQSFNKSSNKQINLFYEKIPGSKFHSPDGTWWGYNQNKISRFKDYVFTYVIENSDESDETISQFVIYAKSGDGEWQKGASFPTSRPGNILIDSQGVLHVFVFEPFDVKTNDSRGKIVHYFFPNSALGDITNYQQEIVVDNDGKSETANIRVGAAIGKDDTMAISFGLTKFNPSYNKQSEHIYSKKPDGEKWHHTFTDGLPHDYYYPFALVSEDSVYLLPVQDDFSDDGDPATYDNIYQKIMYFEYKNTVWKNMLVADLSSHPLAAKRPRLLEQEDLFEDTRGNIHILYKEFLDDKESWKATAHKHGIIKNGKLEIQDIKLDKEDINWVRLFEIEEILYYFVNSWQDYYIGKIGSSKSVKLDIPGATGAYPYIATSKGGTQSAEEYLDIILLAADKRTYKEGKNINLYIRIPKEEIYDKVN